MRFYLSINGHPIEYIKEDGIKFSRDYRNEKSVVTANGTLYQRSKEKLIINVDMMDMDDRYYTEVLSYLREANPCIVQVTDFENQVLVDTYYYLKGITAGVMRTKGNISLISGFSFELTEK